MPLSRFPGYVPARWRGNPHLQTIFPSYFRFGPLGASRRAAERWRSRGSRLRLELPDGDFVDLDRFPPAGEDAAGGAGTGVAVLCHGLEGSSAAGYIRGMSAALGAAGWATVAWNYRGCSGSPNRFLRGYHSGSSDDLSSVVDHVRKTASPGRLVLVGFSLGGNIVLKYLAEEQPDFVDAAVTFSVPCDLAGSAEVLSRPDRRIYFRAFLRSFKAKFLAKRALWPGDDFLDGFDAVRSFEEYDDRYTAPLHGFGGAREYWRRCSSGPLVPLVKTPTLILTSLDDPFLSPGCYPVAEAEASDTVFLETPGRGGHLGFVGPGGYWAEERGLRFLADVLG